jgi:hypothetical protein
MEKMMFKDFTKRSIMVAIIEQLDGWKDAIAIREHSFGTERRGTYTTANILKQGNESHTDETFKAPKNWEAASTLKPLDKAIRAAMNNSESDLRRELGNFDCPDHVYFQNSVTIRDRVFVTYRTSESHGVIFFRGAVSANSLVPAIVRAIFLVMQDKRKHVLLAVHRYLAPPTSLPNPFARYPDFGASLWSSETQKEVTIVPGNRDIYHAIYRDWTHEIMVMKPLNRVSNVLLIGKWN